MKKFLLLTFVTILFSINLQAQPKGSTCSNSAAAENNIAIIKLAANSVGQMSNIASQFMEEQPEAEIALATIEVAADVVEAVADAFENNQYGVPKSVEIPWNNLNETPMEWYGFDGDIIDMYRVSGTGKLNFKQSNSDWWKGVVIFEKEDTNKWYEVMCLYDNQEEMTMDITPGLSKVSHITLSKAKAFGVHSNMYAITNWNKADTNYDYYFNWKKD